jgi:leader peptidase (prepilin peptidase)/N-methyltransferase
LVLPLLIAALMREGGLGVGDIKLTAAAGFVMGLPAGIVGLILGLSAVLLYHLVIRVIRKLKQLKAPAASKSVLPLAPFLSAGFIAAYFMKFGRSDPMSISINRTVVGRYLFLVSPPSSASV